MIFNPEIIAMILVQFALLTFINIAQDFWDRTVALRTWFRRTAQLKNLKLFIRIWKNFPISGKRVHTLEVVFWIINPWIYFPEKRPGIVYQKKVIFWRIGCPQGWNKNSNGGLRVVILKSAWEKNKIRAKNIAANGSILGLKWPQMTFWPQLIFFHIDLKLLWLVGLTVRPL